MLVFKMLPSGDFAIDPDVTTYGHLDGVISSEAKRRAASAKSRKKRKKKSSSRSSHEDAAEFSVWISLVNTFPLDTTSTGDSTYKHLRHYSTEADRERIGKHKWDAANYS